MTIVHYPTTPRLAKLQQRDEDKKENDKAKNNLESYVFENLELMETEMVIAASQEEEREKIISSLRESITSFAWRRRILLIQRIAFD